MKKTFIIIAVDVLGNVIWGAAPTLKETATFVLKQLPSLEKADAYLYTGTGKVKVLSETKIEFSDPDGKIYPLGKGFDLTNLSNLQ